MLVCHCHAINDLTIRRAVESGARCRNDVRKACGAGSSCGGCRPAIDRLIETHHDGQSSVEASNAQG